MLRPSRVCGVLLLPQVLRRMAALNKRRLPVGIALVATDGASAPTTPHGAAAGKEGAAHACAGSPTKQGAGSALAAAGAAPGRSAGGAARACAAGVAAGARGWLSHVRQLLQPPLLAYTAPLIVTWLGLCGGWYSMILWIPTYFQRRCAPLFSPDGAGGFQLVHAGSDACCRGRAACRVPSAPPPLSKQS